jgi:hypothetical protein
VSRKPRNKETSRQKSVARYKRGRPRRLPCRKFARKETLLSGQLILVLKPRGSCNSASTPNLGSQGSVEAKLLNTRVPVSSSSKVVPGQWFTLIMSTLQNLRPAMESGEIKCGNCCKKHVKGTIHFKACGRCKQEIYCSKECQSQDWKVHKVGLVQDLIAWFGVLNSVATDYFGYRVCARRWRRLSIRCPESGPI